jgi:hypothetical protein
MLHRLDACLEDASEVVLQLFGRTEPISGAVRSFLQAIEYRTKQI